DGIRGLIVTGVQTCALPILDRLRFFRSYAARRGFDSADAHALARQTETATVESRADFWRRRDTRAQARTLRTVEYTAPGAKAYEIGRASCRERAEYPRVG